MAILSLSNVSMSFGGPKLLDGVSVQIEAGQRVCIVGRNGAGKSTLLRLLSGDLAPDAGEIYRAPGLKLARLSQKVPETLTGTVFEVAAQGLGELGRSLARYHAARTAGDAAALAAAQDAISRAEGWDALSAVEAAISRLGLEPEARFEDLSGGLKRRGLLARAIASDPDVLLLDEPTNHLDIDSIAWLEDFLLRRVKTLVFITHDRMLLKKLATRILELDRGRLADFSCDYTTFLERKEAMIASEEKTWSEFDKKLAREEAWIRQGVKARRTRDEGRVRALMRMREERSQRRERSGDVSLAVQEAERSGALVVQARGAGFAWGGKTIFRDLDLTILRGDKVGVIGPNGAGKTTLLQVLLGRMEPTSGAVRRGAHLETAYFDQNREELDADKTVRDSIADGAEYVKIDGRMRHVMGYLQDFLFSAERANTPVRLLSGGERNRLLLARLFTRPCNLLVMDEPTNDLDAETLELLEDRLVAFAGTLILVSHDRAFLNDVVTSTLAFEGRGVVREYVGGYDDWLRQRPRPAETAHHAEPKPERRSQAKPRKRTFKEERELAALRAELPGLPGRIEALEAGIAAAEAKLADPKLYKGPAEGIQAARDELAKLQAEHEAAFARWEAADARAAALAAIGS